jgi:hypothetical protein
MKSFIYRTVSKFLTAGVCGLALATTAFAQVEDWDFGARRLEGSWKVQVTQRNCGTGVALAPAFNSLLTFARGGTLMESTSSPAFFPSVRGPGHGVWSHTNRHRTFKAFSVAHITLNGVLTRTQTITQTIVFGDDPDSFDSTATIQFVPADGSPAINGCATAVAQRIE